MIPPLTIEPVSRSRVEDVDLGAVAFSSVMSDHMLVAEYLDGDWRTAAIRPYGPLALSPAISALQYGVSVFTISPGLVRTALTEGLGDDAPWTPPALAPRLVRALASGRADRLSGRDAQSAYEGSVVSTKLKVMGVELAVMGEKEPAHELDEVVTYAEPARASQSAS